MDNPFTRRTAKKIGATGRKSEKRLAKSLRARLTPGSGNQHHSKGDMTWRTNTYIPFLIEAKSTTGVTLRVDIAWLAKITQEALNKNVEPMLMVSFINPEGKPVQYGEWAMVPRRVIEAICAPDPKT